jgi:phosphate starvation-inducible PhoH-like protein|tara:strand:- start:639 stop:1577 length:939 start_codon:yes stop_codon:yes gene_type:complete
MKLEKKITDETLLVSLLGINDENLRYLKKQFPSTKINVRGESFYLDGEEEAINEISHLLDKLSIMASTNKNITPEDILIHNNIEISKEDLADNKKFEMKFDNGVVIRIKNLNQYKYLESLNSSTITFGVGPAGTGKTFLAVAYAVKLLTDLEVKKIVLTRPAVEAGERLGYLPGDLSQKIDPYLVPLFDALEYFLGNEKVSNFIENRAIEIVPLAYMRGRTLNDACILLDEAQNSTMSQIKMFLTRLGVNSKMVITGDETQIDLPNKLISGLQKARTSLAKINKINVIEFENTDIIRNPLVAEILEALPKNK